MNLTITGRNVEATPALKEYAAEKLGKLEKYLSKVTSAHVILTVEKYRHIAEVTIQAHGFTLRGLEETGDMYSSIDKVMDKVEIQARKLKEKIREKNKGAHPEETAAAPPEEPAPLAPGARPRIVRNTGFDPKPMTAEEAAMQLSMRDDHFMVFQDSQTRAVSVIYRRGDGAFGLIETA